MDVSPFNRYRMGADGWCALFQRASIDAPSIEPYAHKFEEHKIRLCDVQCLNRGLFLELGVHFIGDGLAIQRVAGEIMKSLDEQKDDSHPQVDSSVRKSNAVKVEPEDYLRDKRLIVGPIESRKRALRNEEPPRRGSVVASAAVAVSAKAKVTSSEPAAKKAKPMARLQSIAARARESYRTSVASSASSSSSSAASSDSEDERRDRRKRDRERDRDGDRKLCKVPEKKVVDVKPNLVDFRVTRPVPSVAVHRATDSLPTGEPKVVKVCILSDSLLSHVKLGYKRFLKPGREYTRCFQDFTHEWDRYGSRLDVKQFSYTGLKAFSGGSGGQSDRDCVFGQLEAEYPDKSARPTIWFVLVGVNDLRCHRDEYGPIQKRGFIKFFGELRDFAPEGKFTWIGIGGLQDNHPRKRDMDACREDLKHGIGFPSYLTFVDLCHSITNADFKDEFGHWHDSFIRSVSSRLITRIKEAVDEELKPKVDPMSALERRISGGISKKPAEAEVKRKPVEIRRKPIEAPDSGNVYRDESPPRSKSLKSSLVIPEKPSSVSDKRPGFVMINGKVTRRMALADKEEDEVDAEYGPSIPKGES